MTLSHERGAPGPGDDGPYEIRDSHRSATPPTHDAADRGRSVDAETHPVRTEEDLLTARHAVRAVTQELGFSLVDQTRVVTAASELARNAYLHGGGGTLTIDRLKQTRGRGVRLVVQDEGPGIGDLESALEDGFTTGGGLGHGLGGARRLMHEFDVRSVPGQGTTITVVRWVGQ